jgi:vacuolar-type H+-ATPase subunit H
LEAGGEKLLQDLVSYEQNLVSKVDAAKADASKILEEANADAQSLREGAEERGKALADEQVDKLSSAAAEAREEILAQARADVASIEGRAEQNSQQAVQFLLERVLP